MTRKQYQIDPASAKVFAERVFESGHIISNQRQQRVIAALARRGAVGVSPLELAERESPGNVRGVNTWGGAFTVLRQSGDIVALDEVRRGHHVYVLPEHVEGRATWPGYHHHGHCDTCTCFERESA